LTKDFLFKYSDYIGEEEVLFIHGDENGYNALIFGDNEVGSVGLKTGSNKEIKISRRTGKLAEDVFLDNQNRKINVEIDGISYVTNLRDGQNFFFFIIKEDQNERIVARG